MEIHTETRNEKFRRLAEKRMSQLYLDMNKLANLAYNSRYEATLADIQELFRKYHKQGLAIRAYFDSPMTLWNELPTSFAFENTEPATDDKKHALFRELATKRMEAVFLDARLIVNLSNKSNYTYSPQEVDLLLDGYEAKGTEIFNRFIPLKEKFKFDA
ncbi:hypothetical protein [Lacticaseibacillus hulanensis]|uniref:hypothetical protein n=1 Tax=Lacticaseibacillus hulanensis TaxID=2493111 RepID=UPI000FD97135|nr:hypothetical protein [Lacticaseibacillus hulanensis]